MFKSFVALSVMLLMLGGCSATQGGGLYDGRIRTLTLNKSHCGKIQFRQDGGIVIQGCEEELLEAIRKQKALTSTPE